MTQRVNEKFYRFQLAEQQGNLIEPFSVEWEDLSVMQKADILAYHQIKERVNDDGTIRAFA